MKSNCCLIYDIFNHLFEKRENFTYTKEDLYLIYKYIEMLVEFVKRADLDVEEIKGLSQGDFYDAKIVIYHLIADLLHAIKNEFPRYYDPKIIYMGTGLRDIGGISPTLNMSSYYSFVYGLCEYDYWMGGDLTEELINAMLGK